MDDQMDAIERQRHIEHTMRGLANALNPIIDDCFGPEMGF